MLSAKTKAFIRNHFNFHSTFENIPVIENLTDGDLTEDMMYQTLGFEGVKDFQNKLSAISTDILIEGIGYPNNSINTVLYAEYLRGLDFFMLPESNLTLGQLITASVDSDIKTKLQLLDYVSNQSVIDIIQQFYPEIVVDKSIKQEGIYLGKMYSKNEFIAPKVLEVVAYMINMTVIPSNNLVEISEAMTVTPNLVELLMPDEFVNVSHMMSLYSVKMGIPVNTIWTSLGVKHFNFQSTIADGVFLVGHNNEKGFDAYNVMLMQTDGILTLTAEQFAKLYNEDMLQTIYVDNLSIKADKAHYPDLTDSELEETTITILEALVGDNQMPMYKYLGLKDIPMEPLSYLE